MKMDLEREVYRLKKSVSSLEQRIKELENKLLEAGELPPAREETEKNRFGKL